MVFLGECDVCGAVSGLSGIQAYKITPVYAGGRMTQKLYPDCTQTDPGGHRICTLNIEKRKLFPGKNCGRIKCSNAEAFLKINRRRAGVCSIQTEN